MRRKITLTFGALVALLLCQSAPDLTTDAIAQQGNDTKASLEQRVASLEKFAATLQRQIRSQQATIIQEQKKLKQLKQGLENQGLAITKEVNRAKKAEVGLANTIKKAVEKAAQALTKSGNNQNKIGHLQKEDDKLRKADGKIENQVKGVTQALRQLRAAQSALAKKNVHLIGCQWGGSISKTPSRPNWASGQCPAGKVMQGVRYTHTGGQNYTYQETYQILCCSVVFR